MTGRAVIEVRGLDDTLRALRSLDPKAMAALRKGFRETTGEIVDKTKRNVPSSPMSGWGAWKGRLDYDPGKVASGVRAQVSVTKRAARLRLVNSSAPGAVFETAGSKNDQRRTPANRVAQSRAFNSLLASRYGEAPRLLVRTWKQEKGIKTTFTAVSRLIADAEAQVEKVTAG